MLCLTMTHEVPISPTTTMYAIQLQRPTAAYMPYEDMQITHVCVVGSVHDLRSTIKAIPNINLLAALWRSLVLPEAVTPRASGVEWEHAVRHGRHI